MKSIVVKSQLELETLYHSLNKKGYYDYTKEIIRNKERKKIDATHYSKVVFLSKKGKFEILEIYFDKNTKEYKVYLKVGKFIKKKDIWKYKRDKKR